MHLRAFALGLVLAGVSPAAETRSPSPAMSPIHGLVLHGGAGVITRENLTPELEARYREDLGRALAAGHAVLAGGGTALDAVIAQQLAEVDRIAGAQQTSVLREKLKRAGRQ